MKNHTKTKFFLLTSLLAAMSSANAQSAVGTWLDVGKVKGALTNGWQVGLNTNKDPSNNGRSNTNNASNGGVGGLYGGLQETQLATLFGNPVRHPVQLVSMWEITVPNGTNGSIKYVANPEFNDTASVSDSSSYSNSVKTGVEISFKISGSAFGIGAEAGGKVTEDFTRTSTTTNTTTTTRSIKFSESLTVDVPAKSTYVVTLVCQEEKVDLPYQSNIKLSGTSNTWFSDRVNGHYNYYNNVAGVISHMTTIPSGWYVQNDGSVVIIGAQGVLTSQQSTKCSAATHDITKLPPNQLTSLRTVRANSMASFGRPGATLVSVTPMR